MSPILFRPFFKNSENSVSVFGWEALLESLDLPIIRDRAHQRGIANQGLEIARRKHVKMNIDLLPTRYLFLARIGVMPPLFLDETVVGYLCELAPINSVSEIFDVRCVAVRHAISKIFYHVFHRCIGTLPIPGVAFIGNNGVNDPSGLKDAVPFSESSDWIGGVLEYMRGHDVG